MTNHKINSFVLALMAGGLIFTATAKASDLNQGQQKYQQHCAQCHGIDGENRLPQAANFKRREGLRQSDRALFNRIRQGKNGCPAYAGILKDQEILNVVTYLRKLGR